MDTRRTAELVMQGIAGKSNRSVSIENGMQDEMLYQWIRKYKICGYNGLVERKKRRPAQESNIENNRPSTPHRRTQTETSAMKSRKWAENSP